ncbi:hypothetical protein SLS62_001197 [Diatrype stigma]|uniref:Rhodopsin domain-containing protein n=1 Tax=Diatrype stigma TaxID=117547 RepID=A0AAN9YW96_9PEZI
MPRVLTPTARSLILWLSTATSIFFCLFRLWLRKWRGQHLTYGDYWVLLGLPFMALNVGAGFFVNIHYTPLELEKECGNILTDFLLLLIPFPIIFKANLAAWKRIRLSVVFGLGLLLVGMNIIRLYRGLYPWGVFNASQRLLWSSVEMTVAAVVATLPTIYILLRPSFYKIRTEEHTTTAAASERGMQQKKRQNSTWPSWATSEFVYDGGGTAARGSTHGGGLPRVPSMAHYQPSLRQPGSSGIYDDDSWGRGPWSGGHQWFDTQISSGTVSTSASASASWSRRSMDHDNRGCASGVITVETVVEQETVDISAMSEITEIASFMTLPPMAKFNGNPV